jgi:hypothetical protein
LSDTRPSPLVPAEVDVRADALSRGQRHYFTGRPCPSGHNGLRNTLTAECVECRRRWRKEQKARDRAKFKGGSA